MSIKFHCACGAILHAEEGHAGKRAKCNNCGNVVAIPASSAQTPAVKPSQSSPRRTPTRARFADMLGSNTVFRLLLPVVLVLIVVNFFVVWKTYRGDFTTVSLQACIASFADTIEVTGNFTKDTLPVQGLMPVTGLQTNLSPLIVFSISMLVCTGAWIFSQQVRQRARSDVLGWCLALGVVAGLATSVAVFLVLIPKEPPGVMRFSGVELRKTEKKQVSEQEWKKFPIYGFSNAGDRVISAKGHAVGFKGYEFTELWDGSIRSERVQLYEGCAHIRLAPTGLLAFLALSAVWIVVLVNWVLRLGKSLKPLKRKNRPPGLPPALPSP